MFIYKILLFPLFIILSITLNSNAQFIGGRIDIPFKLSLSQDNDKIKVNFKLKGDAHIYKDSISIEEIPNYKIKFPYSINKLDKFSNKRRDLYDRDFSLIINLKDLKIKNNQVNLTVKYQGCTSKVCFLPQRQKLTLNFNKR
ncbi:MAG: hypothetical protein KatS3mg068_0899 [Candidatus Sericytochromatia bacterium]|nr:MAG: hypothetical protein KatS3mg068_0899 [Candidatus Sericytochromatia bacterium]